MLSAETPFPAPGKQLHLRIATASLRALLTALLPLWRYTLLPEPAAGNLELIEDTVTTAGGALLLQGPAGSRAESFSLPLVMEEFWRTLEAHFHQPPRNHLRMDLSLDAAVEIRGVRYPTQLTSLSDAGGRFLFTAELPIGQPLRWHFAPAGISMSLDARVIYACPRGPRRVEVGLVFHPRHQWEMEQLRAFIVATYLQRVRRRLAAAGAAADLGHFALTPDVQTLLEKGAEPLPA